MIKKKKKKRPERKKCRACKKTFPTTTEYFYPSSGPLGLSAACHDCHEEFARTREAKRNRSKESRYDDCKVDVTWMCGDTYATVGF